MGIVTRIAGCVLCVGSAWAQAAQIVPEVTIDPGGVPPAVLQAVARAVDNIAALSADQDGGEVDRLRRRAREVTLTALATEGYFSPHVTLEAGTDVAGETWDITINPGERSTVASVGLVFTGAISGPAYAARVQTMRDAWSLPVGEPFRNPVWDSAKRTLLTSVSERDFALAVVERSEARVDAEAAEVHLTVTLASGPQVIFGEMQVEGLKRVPESLIGRYVTYQPGQTPYDRRDMIAWQQSLQSTVFFRSVDLRLTRGRQARPQPEVPASEVPAVSAMAAENTAKDATESDGAPDPDASASAAVMQRDRIVVPLAVNVLEAPARRVSVAVGVDSDVGPSFETMYRQNVVAGQALELQAGLRLDSKRQLGFADLHAPPDARGYRDSVGVLAQHSDIQGQDVRRVAAGLTRLQTRQAAGDSRVEYETRTGLLAAYDDVRIDGADNYTLPSLTATYQWLRRDVDSKYNPREGHLLELGGGVGSALNGFDPYTRLRARGQYWWPIGKRDLITVRAEVGKVWAAGTTQIPDDFGFRTGGARSIRGYSYLKMGSQLGDAVVGAPALLVGSVEYQHFFTDTLGIGFFVDAGDAADSFRSMDIAVGTGVGARVRTPAGPLFFDVAYAARDKKLRLNFSLGIAF